MCLEGILPLSAKPLICRESKSTPSLKLVGWEWSSLCVDCEIVSDVVSPSIFREWCRKSKGKSLKKKNERESTGIKRIWHENYTQAPQVIKWSF